MTKREIEKTLTLKVGVDNDSHTQDYDCSSWSFSAEITTEKEIYELSGDEDAVPDDIRCKIGESEYEEDEDELAEELIDKVYDQINSYYF